MWEFRTGNTFGATAFTSYGAFWLAVGWSIQNRLILSHTAFGFFLLGWTIFTGIMILCSVRVTYAHVALFVFLFLTFLSLAIAELSGGSSAFITIQVSRERLHCFDLGQGNGVSLFSSFRILDHLPGLRYSE